MVTARRPGRGAAREGRRPVSAIAASLGRATMYRLCGTALGYPAPERLAEVARLAQAAARGAEGAVREPLAALAQAAGGTDAESLATEYVLLFDGAVKCPPYEGAYGAPQMAGKSAQLADIAGFYTAFGLEPAAGQPDVEDHVATELEFLSALALKEAWALAEDHHEHAEVTRQATTAFLADHLGRWAPSFATSLRAATDLPYYRAVADLLTAWLTLDTTVLGVTPSPLEPSRADPEGAEPFDCPEWGPRAATTTVHCPEVSAD
jgi:TorA maturation chaperone TorD